MDLLEHSPDSILYPSGLHHEHPDEEKYRPHRLPTQTELVSPRFDHSYNLVRFVGFCSTYHKHHVPTY
jgi:hypothetical protein